METRPLVVTAIACVAAPSAVPIQAIDHQVARGMLPGAAARGGQPSAWSMLLGSRPLLVFAATFGLFHLANGSMSGQKMAPLNPGQGQA